MAPPGKSFELHDLLRVLRRRRDILVPFVVIALGSAAVVYRLPDKYRSETLIMVVPQRVPESYVRSTVTTRIEDRLRSINQQITSRTRLEPLIREFNLYPDLLRSSPMEDVIERMRIDIQTQIIRADAFRISYVSNDPHTAMVVTARIASMYIEESLRDREVLADSTNQFLDSQLAAAKQSLIEHEEKLEAYKMRYSGQLPSQVQANLQVMQNAQLQIQSLVDSLNRDRDRRLVLQGELADRGAPVSGDDEQDPGPAPTPAAKDLAAAQKTLEEMLQHLTPSHPDVLQQREVVADLQKKVADEAALPAQGRKPAADQPEVARRDRIKEIRAELDSLNRQVAQKEQDEAKLRAAVADYQTRVEAAPAREAELTELMRDYDTIEHSYTSLLAKKEDAQVSANLERRQIGEQFKVLDPARLPERPFSPRRPLFYGIGTAMGLCVGLLFAAVREYGDKSMKNESDVVAALTLPTLAMIPELMTVQRLHRRTQRRRAAWVVATAATLVLAVVAAWAWRRLGMP